MRLICETIWERCCEFRCPVFHRPILCLATQLRTVHARKQQIYAQNSMEKLPWMEKYLWTNTRIISIICHKWWTWCLFYERAKITGKTLKYFSIHCWRVNLPWMKTEHFMVSTLDFFRVFFMKNFFSKIWVAKLGVRLICECGLSASLYGIWKKVLKYQQEQTEKLLTLQHLGQINLKVLNIIF